MNRRFGLLALLCTLPATLQAQGLYRDLHEYLKSRPAPVVADSVRWRAGGELSFTDVSGNKSLSLLTTGLNLRRDGGHTWALTTGIGVRYGRSDGQLAAESYDAQADFRVLPQAGISPFVYLKGSRDEVRNLNLRLAAAVGAEANVYRHGGGRVSLGLALLQDYEARDIPDTSAAPRTVSLTRFNLRASATTTLRRDVVAEHRSMLEPAANDLGDYLFTSTTSVRVLLGSGLALQTSYIYNRDATPAPGVLFKDDRTLTVGLVVNLAGGGV